MKYREFEAVADWDYQKQPELSSAQNVVALRRPAADYPRDYQKGARPIFVSCASAAASTCGAPVSKPSHDPSWLNKLASDFGIAGQALAFGSLAELGTPRALRSDTVTEHGRREGWLSKSRAAVARRYHRFLSEIAIRRAVRELHTLDAALLRDIGIHDRMMIETFVRGSCDL